MMQADGRAAAAWYGWRLGEADWYYQAGRAPELDDAHVGFVLVCGPGIRRSARPAR